MNAKEEGRKRGKGHKDRQAPDSPNKPCSHPVDLRRNGHRNKKLGISVPETTLPPNVKKVKVTNFEVPPNGIATVASHEWVGPRISEDEPHDDPVANIEEVLRVTREEIAALERVVSFREQHGEETGNLPVLTKKLSDKLAELDLYNKDEAARMRRAWGLAREYDEQAEEDGISKSEAARRRRRRVPGLFRFERSVAWRNTAAAVWRREQRATRRCLEAAPILAACQRLKFLTLEERDRIGVWVVSLPDEFPETGRPAPVPVEG
ncbi:hypothetical protein TWF730_009231 [Orbilia blumenaviensis]|uniref:Uncharacterized protein n=1 Tax=Orbilia blumenaviensis TaxID=1796055 RepID=A0AAV9V0Y0_9PEZI